MVRAAGEEGAIIRLRTRSGQSLSADTLIIEGSEDVPSLTIRRGSDMTARSGFDGLLVIDGVIVSPPSRARPQICFARLGSTRRRSRG